MKENELEGFAASTSKRKVKKELKTIESKNGTTIERKQKQ